MFCWEWKRGGKLWQHMEVNVESSLALYARKKILMRTFERQKVFGETHDFSDECLKEEKHTNKVKSSWDFITKFSIQGVCCLISLKMGVFQRKCSIKLQVIYFGIYSFQSISSRWKKLSWDRRTLRWIRCCFLSFLTSIKHLMCGAHWSASGMNVGCTSKALEQLELERANQFCVQFQWLSLCICFEYGG